MWMRTEGKILVIKDLLKSIPGSQGQASTALLNLAKLNGFEGSFLLGYKWLIVYSNQTSGEGIEVI